MLTVLETLGPAERAVFVLREVFDVPYDEIAEAVGKSPAAVRQIAHRAREHVAARRPRMEVEPRRAAAGRRAVPRRGRDRRPAGPAGRARARRRAGRRRRRRGGRRSGTRSRAASKVAAFLVALRAARARTPRSAPCCSTARRAGADRPRRRARHGDQLRGRGRPDHPHLRDPQPAQARRGWTRRRCSAADPVRTGPATGVRASLPRPAAGRRCRHGSRGVDRQHPPARGAAGDGDVRARRRHVDHERVDRGGRPRPRHDRERRAERDRARGARLRRVHPDRQQGRRPHRSQARVRARPARLRHRRDRDDAWRRASPRSSCSGRSSAGSARHCSFPRCSRSSTATSRARRRRRSTRWWARRRPSPPRSVRCSAASSPPTSRGGSRSCSRRS